MTILYYLGCYFLFNVIALAHFPANAGNNHRNVVPGPAPNLFSTIENEKIYLVLCGASTIITAWISELILSNVEKDSFSAFLAGYSCKFHVDILHLALAVLNIITFKCPSPIICIFSFAPTLLTGYQTIILEKRLKKSR